MKRNAKEAWWNRARVFSEREEKLRVSITDGRPGFTSFQKRIVFVCKVISATSLSSGIFS